MKEEILKKVEELFAVLKEHKIAASFIADIGTETIKATNVGKERQSHLIIHLLDDDEVQNYFLSGLELRSAEQNG